MTNFSVQLGESILEILREIRNRILVCFLIDLRSHVLGLIQVPSQWLQHVATQNSTGDLPRRSFFDCIGCICTQTSETARHCWRGFRNQRFTLEKVVSLAFGKSSFTFCSTLVLDCEVDAYHHEVKVSWPQLDLVSE
jgi:hypothetical protein